MPRKFLGEPEAMKRREISAAVGSVLWVRGGMRKERYLWRREIT